jgi:hypothetical protein
MRNLEKNADNLCTQLYVFTYVDQSVAAVVGNCNESIALLQSVDFFVKTIKVSMQLEPIISTESSSSS